MQFSGPLKQNYLFRRLYSRGRHRADSFLAMYCRRNGTQRNRVGITVSAKLGKAVRRNRVRRRLREIYRLNEERFRPGQDIVIVARSRAMQASYRQLEQSCLTLAEQLHLLRSADSVQTEAAGVPETGAADAERGA